MTAARAPRPAYVVARIARHLLTTFAILATVLATPAASRPTDEAAVHAAYVINFVRYARWPDAAPGRSLVIAVIGTPDAVAPLRALARRVGTVDGRPLVVRDIALARIAPTRAPAVAAVRDEAADAQLLFIAPSHHAWSRAAVAAVAGRPVLTVGTGAEFLAAGGMFALFADDGRIRFAANAPAVRASGVDVSARVLMLARPVGGAGR